MLLSNNGDVLRRLRLKHNLKQIEIAEELNISQTRYSNWENKYSGIPDEYIYKFCEFLNEDVNQFAHDYSEHAECALMDSDFEEIKFQINSINDSRLRRKFVFEFGDFIEQLRAKIKQESLNGEK